ncbi:disease resistance-like protein DSC2 isoform X2 [Rosa chinensis]|uniref:disease resistance-like protein DSC2 isoform X2 n=1 Tax=Rosa chinensis TaxID=74649 RepID=UPI000D091A6A|nr:disease resistance-like protein DSC2 isoform X2 [Rosa chinensis]XP_024156587.1 disease resistance-like protein DSC2 isoform X2 [Rosa chinensis]XP_040363396.1 disease resistance-like protein DSC2 isoform X2 [Rosa chinensis]
MASIPKKTDASLPSSAEPSSTARRWKYDVFLSFRGTDFLRGFPSHLYYQLQERGITTFMDDSDLEAADDMSPTLLEAIEGSRLAIVVLTSNYASSARCLEQLTKICQIMEDGTRILPVYYVDPIDVRNQRGQFQDAFAIYEKYGQYTSEKVQQWRDALRKVGSLPGLNTRDYRTHRDFVEAILESVCYKVQSGVEIEKVQPIEINTRGPEVIEETTQAMDRLTDDDEVSAVGVYGMGGGGKITLKNPLESSSSSAVEWKYDVYLSFRGVDIGRGFTSHLYDCLKKRGINAFMDELDLQVWDSISGASIKAIEKSRFAIVVLSQDYVSSTWCLHELTKICECMEDQGRILPVFYNVEPSDVRYRKRSFGEAFDKHESSRRHTSDKVKRLIDVLNHVASLFGWHAKLYKTDRELVDNIVDFVCSKVHPIEIEFTMSTGDFEAFESRRTAMNEVMKALTDDKVTAVGVYGIGGVGKTTMVEHVSEAVQNNGMFQHVITAVVSKIPNLRKIQGTLADMLGFMFEEETEIGRSRRLMQNIRRGNRILIILDDIWERIDLSNIGIPSYHELQRCNSKVLLTTRTQNVCCAMKCQSNISLDVLSEEDSWTLFVNKARMSFESTNFCDVAKKVARACAGLPVALIAVAKALGDKCLDDWTEAARRLEASQPANLEDGKVAFNCIKLSYDYLISDDARSCFLLCCLFPEDYDIQIEDLLKYGMGKGLFQDSSTMHDARASAYSVVKYLKDCGLLLKSERDGCVKMHDVIRDVAIRVSSSEDGPLFFVQADCQLKEWPSISAHDGYSAISLIRNKICKLPEELVCPKLLILFLQSNVWLNVIPECFFQSLNVLRVLDLSQTRISLLPTSFNILINLQTLYLDGCLSTIDNISILGNLKKLEILSMKELPLVELPKEIGDLNHLRMLDITGDYVDNVPSEVICNLTSLEELYMQCNFADWRSKVEGAGEEIIVAFDELTGLSYLNVLKVFISDAKCLPRDVEVEPNWVKFDICISRDPSIRKGSLVSSSSPAFVRALTLDTSINALPGWFINVVTMKAEKLQYIMCWGLDNILVEFDCGRLHALKYLSVIGPNENLKVLMNTVTRFRNEPVFQNLEELHLIQVDCLKELCVGELPPGSLCNLRLLKVKHCYELVDALLPSQLLQRLQNLKELICEEMDELKYIFGCEELEPKQLILTELIEMRLENLGKLIKIWNGPAHCAVFRNLQSLVVSRCFELETLFTADVAQCFLHLGDLSVELCPMLDSIIEASKDTVDNMIVFPELKNLTLIKLPQLTRFTRFCGSTGNAIECPLLEYLYVERCPQFSTSDFHSRNKVQFNHPQQLDIVQRRRDHGEIRKLTVPAPQIGNTEIPPDDGFTWRKYGQKEIMGCRFPRAYYRCNHRNSYNCPATKQVQRLDNDHLTFEVINRGDHTCHMSSTAPSSLPPSDQTVERFPQFSMSGFHSRNKVQFNHPQQLDIVKRRRDRGEIRKLTVPAPQIGSTEIPPDDGFTWRKYGQKEIMGCSFPRARVNGLSLLFFMMPLRCQLFSSMYPGTSVVCIQCSVCFWPKELRASL